MHQILDQNYTLAETARLSGLSTAALYKAVARNSLSIASKAAGCFAFSFDGVIAVAAYADLLRAGVHSSIADVAARQIADAELPAHLLVRKRVEVWCVLTRTAARDDVVIAYGADKLRDALYAAHGHTSTLIRLHSLTADVAEAIDAMRAEGAL